MARAVRAAILNEHLERARLDYEKEKARAAADKNERDAFEKLEQSIDNWRELSPFAAEKPGLRALVVLRARALEVAETKSAKDMHALRSLTRANEYLKRAAGGIQEELGASVLNRET